MKLKFTITALFFLLFNSIYSQCLTAIQYESRLQSIENNPAADTTNLREAQQLYDLYTACKAAKDSVHARIAHRLGNFYRLTGNIEKGISYTKEAININSTAGKGADRSFLSNSYFNLGLCFWQEDLYAEAQIYFDSCIYFARQFPSKLYVLFRAFEKKAFSFYQTGDYHKSIETAEDGILSAVKAKDSLFEAILLCQKAQSELELNSDAEAEKNIERAIGILKGNVAGERYLATGYSIYASVFTKKNLPATAIRYYENSFKLNKKYSESAQCARDMHNLGYLYDNVLHDYRKALACYQKGIKIVGTSKASSELLGFYINTGVVFWRQKNYRQALFFYQKALNILHIRFSDTSIQSNPSADMLKLVSNDYYVATLLANKADALLDEYKAERKQEILLIALNTYSIADSAVDLMRRKQHGEQTKLFWRQKTKSMYEHAIEVCYLLKNIPKGLYFFEKSRAVLLNDKVNELGAKRFISAEDRIKEQALTIKISSLYQQLSSLNESSLSFNSIKQQLLSGQEKLEQFVKNLEKKYPYYYKYKYDNAVYPLDVIKQKLLAEKQSLVEYFTGDSAMYILSLTQNGNSFLKVPVEDYSAASRQLLALCSDRTLLNQNYRRYADLASLLYKKLFKPLNIPGGRVIISPDENFIPMDALLSDSNDPGSFLLKRYAFSYAYSMGLLVKETVEQLPAGNSFLGVAPVNYQSYLNQQSLDGADESLNAIKKYFQPAKFLLGQKATKQEFLKYFSLFSIVQVYSHANADSAGSPPVLYLNDSSVNMAEIQTMENVKTDMIVLSACKTGIGKNARGEGIFSLARAFTAVGIPSTVTTLWQIDNKATYQLTENFYRYLNMGLSKDVALQRAKLDFITDNDKTYNLPYFWAANILLGKADVLNNHAGHFSFFPSYIIICIIAALLIITTVILFPGIKRSVYSNQI